MWLLRIHSLTQQESQQKISTTSKIKEVDGKI